VTVYICRSAACRPASFDECKYDWCTLQVFLGGLLCSDGAVKVKDDQLKVLTVWLNCVPSCFQKSGPQTRDCNNSL